MSACRGCTQHGLCCADGGCDVLCGLVVVVQLTSSGAVGVELSHMVPFGAKGPGCAGGGRDDSDYIRTVRLRSTDDNDPVIHIHDQGLRVYIIRPLSRLHPECAALGYFVSKIAVGPPGDRGVSEDDAWCGACVVPGASCCPSSGVATSPSRHACCCPSGSTTTPTPGNHYHC
jgi:hypothetical protein